MEQTTQSAETIGSGNGRSSLPAPGTRSSNQIRDDIVAQRQQLSRSVDALRSRWGEATDVRRQLRAHKTELIVGAAVVGALIGGAIAFGRRR